MLDKDPKKMAAGVLGRAFGENSAFSSGKRPGEVDGTNYAEGGEVGEVDEGKTLAAEEMISAFHAKDAKKLASSLESFVEQCYGAADESEMVE